MASNDLLFSPIRIGKLTLPGRLIKTATAGTCADDDGFANDRHFAFYVPMAKGGVPLIITGNIYVARDGKSAPRQLGIDHDDKIPALRQLVEAVHRHGTKMFAQLNHCGRQVVPRFAGATDPVSASDVTELITGTKPRPLRTEEIERIVAQYAEGAQRCQRAGFDSVQIHAANGYLQSQFLTPHTNRRQDQYGGDLGGRTRFLRQTLRAIKVRCGEDFPVIVKLNGYDWLPLRRGLKTPELAEVARLLAQDGADAVEISVGHYESGFPMVRGSFMRCMRNMVHGSGRYLPFLRRWGMRLSWPLLALVLDLMFSRREGFNRDYARQIKAAVSIPVICVGGFRTREVMEAALRMGHCDLVSAGRAFIADPYLYAHLKDNQPGPRCVDCNACVGHLGAQPADSYHPVIRAEKRAMLAANPALEV